MKGTVRLVKIVLFASVLVLAGSSPELGTGWAGSLSADSVETPREERGPEFSEEYPVELKPLPKTITPCRACHGPEKDFPINHVRKEDLLVHTNIKLNHGGARVWCLDCHDPDQRDYLLPLSDGKPIPFEKTYLLCGKCHGTKLRDWRNGVHGKRTGDWNGPKQYYLCINCHNPHSPKFKPIEPMPPPRKPWTPKEYGLSMRVRGHE